MLEKYVIFHGNGSQYFSARLMSNVGGVPVYELLSTGTTQHEVNQHIEVITEKKK